MSLKYVNLGIVPILSKSILIMLTVKNNVHYNNAMNSFLNITTNLSDCNDKVTQAMTYGQPCSLVEIIFDKIILNPVRLFPPHFNSTLSLFLLNISWVSETDLYECLVSRQIGVCIMKVLVNSIQSQPKSVNNCLEALEQLLSHYDLPQNREYEIRHTLLEQLENYQEGLCSIGGGVNYINSLIEHPNKDIAHQAGMLVEYFIDFDPEDYLDTFQDDTDVFGNND